MRARPPAGPFALKRCPALCQHGRALTQGATMPRRQFILACTVLCLTAAPALAADKVVLGMIGAGSTAHWPSYIAIEKGIYAKHGLDIDVVVVPSNPAMQQQIAVNALNIGTVTGSP